MKFRLTYSIVTEESSQQGDHAYHGFVTRNQTFPRKYGYIPENPATFSLRESIDFLLSRDSCGPVEADCCPVNSEFPPRWFTYGGSLDKYGESTQVSLHLPKNVTASSAIRVARLLKCYGLRK